MSEYRESVRYEYDCTSGCIRYCKVCRATHPHPRPLPHLAPLRPVRHATRRRHLLATLSELLALVAVAPLCERAMCRGGGRGVGGGGFHPPATQAARLKLQTIGFGGEDGETRRVPRRIQELVIPLCILPETIASESPDITEIKVVKFA